MVPKATELLDIVNNKLSPFVEEFTLADLDIMSVNSDGSLRSTTGYVEDGKAAIPPVKPSTGTPSEPPTVDENGNLIDPETGAVISPDPETGDTIVIDPATGEAQTPDVSTPETTNPDTGSAETDAPLVVPPDPVPDEPQQPEEIPSVTPEEPGTPDFIIIEPPPAA